MSAHPSWKSELAAAVRDPDTLCAALGLPAPVQPAAADNFPMRVPPAWRALIRTGDPDDPLLRQTLPRPEEDEDITGFGADPVGDGAATVVPGLLHKYTGRALLIAHGACAIHCRYCFRRHYPYSDQRLDRRRRTTALAALAADPSIEEVILSGGDPLLLDNTSLGELLDGLTAIGHLRRLRIHSRIPVVLPSRIDAELIERLHSTSLALVVVIHANHANELGAEAATALAALRTTGATLLNQSVLLRGINDSAEALTALSERLFACGVLPYYLHALDRVAGAAHFEVDDTTAAALMQAIRERLPGYLVPRWVREVAGQPFKVPVEALPTRAT